MIVMRLPVAFLLSGLSACAATEHVARDVAAHVRRLSVADAPPPAKPAPKPKLAKAPPPAPVRASPPEANLPAWSIPVARPGLTLERALPPSELFRRVGHSVYAVVVADKAAQPTSQGSAVAVTTRELITNCHVVSGGGTIRLINGTAILKAEVVAADLATDRCFLRASGDLQPIRALRDHASLQVGETVYTVASPKGFVNTLGQGIVSGLRRAENDVDYVQITAPVSAGSSGGGLFDERGNLIGIVTFTIRDAQNLNFAISAAQFWKADRIAAARAEPVVPVAGGVPVEGGAPGSRQAPEPLKALW